MAAISASFSWTILREFIMEGITYRQDIEETIERYKERVAKNPEDEIAKEVLQDLEWELRLIDRKERARPVDLLYEWPEHQ
ncbi:hypothetical protein HMPREF3036_01671 [Sutterella sp. KLE1602]|jgi:hypothetical protein|uniref:hypothetical protein n=1 Tax=Sutterella sp. KLE1602 TaxID=1574262 RepID=UPI000785B9EF|nr:hypothetical protein [Sutterella sp. KLE1602]KXT33189.1 hypothetical protein HMPREF3036_01671 [Sutterella sp. KLE1602]